MSRPDDDSLLGFVEETLDKKERARVRQQLEADPALAAEIERAAAGLELLRASPAAVPARGAPTRVARWWVLAAAVAASLAIAIPTTWFAAGGSSGSPDVPAAASQAPVRDEIPGFVLVLRNSSSSDRQLGPDERGQRDEALAEWTSQLEADGLLVLASDLAAERGMRIDGLDAPSRPSTEDSDDYIAGLLSLSTDDFREALEIARASPYLRYGGSVTVRHVGAAPQATSLPGEPLYSRADPVGEVAAADTVLAEAPDDLDLLLAAARARNTSWRYREAVSLYTRAIELAPDDWRPHARRGIRHAQLRQFDRAVTDLERARELAPRNYDIAYYLGFAYFLEGRFEDASNEYLRCFKLADDPTSRAAHSYDFRSCSEIADDVGWRVAITDWAVRALRRAGRDSEAMELLDPITPGMPVEAYRSYYHLLLFYKGQMSAQQLLAVDANAATDFETVAFGVANWSLIEGEIDRAVELLEEIVASPKWSAFGRIAAESELARLDTQ